MGRETRPAARVWQCHHGYCHESNSEAPDLAMYAGPTGQLKSQNMLTVDRGPRPSADSSLDHDATLRWLEKDGRQPNPTFLAPSSAVWQ